MLWRKEDHCLWETTNISLPPSLDPHPIFICHPLGPPRSGHRERNFNYLAIAADARAGNHLLRGEGWTGGRGGLRELELERCGMWIMVHCLHHFIPSSWQVLSYTGVSRQCPPSPGPSPAAPSSVPCSMSSTPWAYISRICQSRRMPGWCSVPLTLCSKTLLLNSTGLKGLYLEQGSANDGLYTRSGPPPAFVQPAS